MIWKPSWKGCLLRMPSRLLRRLSVKSTPQPGSSTMSGWKASLVYTPGMTSSVTGSQPSLKFLVSNFTPMSLSSTPFCRPTAK